MQVHLHKANEFAMGTPRNGARGKRTGSSRRRRKETRVGVLSQKEMNGGSDAKRRAALTAESREMAEE
jgi:hypothetical protein